MGLKISHIKGVKVSLINLSKPLFLAYSEQYLNLSPGDTAQNIPRMCVPCGHRQAMGARHVLFQAVTWPGHYLGLPADVV